MLSSRFSFLLLVLCAAKFVNASPLLNRDSSAAQLTSTTPASSCTQPNLSDDPAMWSSRTFIDENLPDPTVPTPIFWSGMHNGGSVAPYAVDCADKTPGGAATIGMLMCQRGGFTMPSVSTPAGNALWAHASEVYAKHTKGDAFVVVGDASVTSIWFGVEFPTLESNTCVKSVVSLDPKSCGKKCYWSCPDPNDCPVSLLFLCSRRSYNLSNLTYIYQGLKPCIVQVSTLRLEIPCSSRNIPDSSPLKHRILSLTVRSHSFLNPLVSLLFPLLIVG